MLPLFFGLLCFYRVKICKESLFKMFRKIPDVREYCGMQCDAGAASVIFAKRMAFNPAIHFIQHLFSFIQVNNRGIFG